MRYEPIADRVIVQPSEENQLTSGGLVIPQIAQQQKHVAFGEVVAVGSGRHNANGDLVPLHVKVGDIVCFPRKAPALIPVLNDDGTEDVVFMLREAEIIAVVYDMPQPSRILDVAGAPLSMVPTSRAMPDSAAENRDLIDRAAHAGWDVSDHADEPNGMTG